MKVYTRRGDSGETDLLGGGRVAKDALRVHAFGEVDELNASVGVACAASRHDDVRALLQRIQNTLFDIGATLATPGEEQRARGVAPAASDDDVAGLEERIDTFETELTPLANFVLPGGTPASAALQLARAVCRRAERRAVALARTDECDGVTLRYLNRLSDLLFVMARLENRRAGVADVSWVGRER